MKELILQMRFILFLFRKSGNYDGLLSTSGVNKQNKAAETGAVIVVIADERANPNGYSHKNLKNMFCYRNLNKLFYNTIEPQYNESRGTNQLIRYSGFSL